MNKLANADSILFDYINERVKSLHSKKISIEEKLQKKSRKHKQIYTKPLEKPMNRWEELTVDEKHNIVIMMIDVVYVSDENGVDIRFSNIGIVSMYVWALLTKINFLKIDFCGREKGLWKI